LPDNSLLPDFNLSKGAIMKITAVEIIPIYPRLAKRYAHRSVDLYGIDHRIVYKVTADNGLVGYSDTRIRPGGCPPRSSVEHLIGRNPFDFINTSRGDLNGALYDLMGKYLEIPAHKLMGEKLRDHVSVAAWTRPAGPEAFRSEIKRAVDQGYMVFKMHSCAYHDVIEQTRLAAEVAPPGFKIHWDFNGNRTLAAMLPIVTELERNHPIVGFIEDPIQRKDIHGWHALRQKTNLPVIMHVPQLGGLQEVLYDLADIYMIGGGVGHTLARGQAYSQLNIQTVFQHEAGTLGKALALHMAAVLPTATGHSINLDDQYEEDYTTKTIPVIEGYSPVPTGPGLGFEVDEEALARLAANKPVEKSKHVGVLHMPGGHTFYGRSYLSPYGEEGTVRNFRSELWEDDGSKEFEQVYERVQKEGRILAD
jgi:L-alanine-DL-glutamate epimerase-like enolase superfamily enzyme